MLLGGTAAPNFSLSSNTMEGNGGSESSETSDGILDQKVVTTVKGNTTISLATESMRGRSRVGLWAALGAMSLVATAATELLEARRRNRF